MKFNKKPGVYKWELFIYFLMWILVFLALSYSCRGQQYDSNCTQLDIIVVGDFSGSVEYKRGYIIEAYEVFISKLNISESNIRIGMVTFNDGSYSPVILTGNKDEIAKGIQILKKIYTGGSTNMLSGLVEAKYMLDQHGRRGVRKIILLISDGGANNGSSPLNFGKLIKSEGIIICSIHVQTEESNRELMKEISSGCYKDSEYESLAYTLNKLNFCI